MRLGLILFAIGLPFAAFSAENESSSKRSTRFYDDYHSNRPSWGVELSGSGAGAGEGNTTTVQTGNLKRQKMGSVHGQVEYQPVFLQNFGVFGFGPTAGAYILSGLNREGYLSDVWSIGGVIRYQARFFPEQAVVPMVSYSVESWNYRMANVDGVQSLTARGPTLGVWVLLNALSSSAGRRAYEDMGLARTYLVAEFRKSKGGDSNLNYDSLAFNLGMRFEF